MGARTRLRRLLTALVSHRMALRGVAAVLRDAERALLVTRTIVARQAPRGSAVDLVDSVVDDLRRASGYLRDLSAELAEDWPLDPD